MISLIQILALAFICGIVWGMAIYSLYLRFRIKRGKLPKFFEQNREKLLTLLKEN